MKILAVDPGDKRIGIAISDPNGIIANPLTILRHISRTKDALAIIALAQTHAADQILIGQALDENNQPTPQSRKAERLANAIRELSDFPVLLWDESYSSLEIERMHQEMGARKKVRRKPIDHLAATYILQTYLDWLKETSTESPKHARSEKPDE